jgi:hypothetical protein
VTIEARPERHGSGLVLKKVAGGLAMYQRIGSLQTRYSDVEVWREKENMNGLYIIWAGLDKVN